MEYEQEKRIINTAVRRLVKDHVASGGSATAIAEGLLQVGAHALTGGIGTAQTATLLRELANKIEADPRLPGNAPIVEKSADDHAAYISVALDSPPAGYDRDSLLKGALAHSSLSLAARHGADPTVRDLQSLAEQIAAGVAAGKLRAGGKAEWN